MAHKTFKELKELMTEASVGSNDIFRATESIVKYLSRTLGATFKEIDGQEYANSSGSYFGFLYISTTNHAALRVNWEGNVFHSINYWNDYATEMAPTMEIFTGKIAPGQSSFARLLPEIAEIIKNGGVTPATDEGDDLEEEPVSESVNEAVEYNGKVYNTRVDVVHAMYDAGKSIDEIKSTVGYPPGHIRKLIAKYTGESEPQTSASGKIKVVKGQAETVTPSKAVKKAQAILDDTEFADPAIVFHELEQYCRLIGQGLLTALMITGQGGVGKSFTVGDVLRQYGKKGEDYVIMKGHCTPSAMYRFLYNHYDKICVFDDCDSIFDSADGMNILKGALDSGDPREISWMTKGSDVVDTFGLEDHKEIEARLADYSAAHGGKEGTPSYFIFEGAVVFISNLSKQAIYKKDRAILSRCTTIDVTLSAQGVISRIKTVLPHIKIYAALKGRGKNGSRDITDEAIKQEVFEWISSEEFLNHPRVRGRELNFRLFDQVYKYRYGGLEDWKDLSYRAGG